MSGLQVANVNVFLVYYYYFTNVRLHTGNALCSTPQPKTDILLGSAGLPFISEW